MEEEVAELKKRTADMEALMKTYKELQARHNETLAILEEQKSVCYTLIY